MDWTLGLGATVAFLVAAVLFLYGRGLIGKKWHIVGSETRRLIMFGGVIWMAAIAITAGWLGFLQVAPETGETTPISADYDVTVSEALSHVAVNDVTNTVTVLLNRDGSAWQSATQYCNLSFAVTRTDAGTADSTVVFDVSSVDTWVETNGLTYHVLQRYSDGDYYADWNEYGTSTSVNDKISIMIDRETESSATANITMIADINAWLLESLGDMHSTVITLKDVGAGWTEVWTVNWVLQDTS